MSDAISGAFDFFGGVASDVASGVGQAASAVGSAIGDVATGVVDTVSSAADALGLGGGTAGAPGAVDAATAGVTDASAATPPLSAAATSAISSESLPALAPAAGSAVGGPVSAGAAQALDQTVIEDVTGAGAAGTGATPGLASLQGPAGLAGATTADAPTPGALTAAADAAGGGGGAPGSGVTAQQLLSTPSTGGAGIDITRTGTGAPASFGKEVSDALSNPAVRLGAAALPLAATLLRGEPAVPPQISTLQGPVTKPLIATETANLAAANAGQITPGDAAQIATYVQDQTNQLFQQLANEGVADPRQDSRFIAGQAEIKQQAAVMTQQFIQQEFTNAFTAAGLASGNLTAAAQAQVNQDTAFQNALSAAMTSFGLLATLGAGGTALAKAP
jgi:hypothetical protein